LARCKHDETDDGTAPAVIRPARRPPIGLITDHSAPSSVPSSFSMTASLLYGVLKDSLFYTKIRTKLAAILITKTRSMFTNCETTQKYLCSSINSHFKSTESTKQHPNGH